MENGVREHTDGDPRRTALDRTEPGDEAAAVAADAEEVMGWLTWRR